MSSNFIDEFISSFFKMIRILVEKEEAQVQFLVLNITFLPGDQIYFKFDVWQPQYIVFWHVVHHNFRSRAYVSPQLCY